MSPIESAGSRLWYVVRSKPASEHRVQTHLDHQGIETFLPLLETRQYAGGKMVRQIRPFFPSYLFAYFDPLSHYARVKWTRGVVRVLGDSAGPIPISEKVIQSIRERAGENDIVTLREEWEEGDPVQITSGPFKDLAGIFQKRLSESGRVKILLSLIGIDVTVQISEWQIKKVA